MSVVAPGREAEQHRGLGTRSACSRPVGHAALDDDLRSLRPRIWIATIAVVGGLLAAVAASCLAGRAQLSLLACAAALGWLNLSAGPCAQNALTAITPLAMGRSRRIWYEATFAYTLAGLDSSFTVGSLLGATGLAAASAASPARRAWRPPGWLPSTPCCAREPGSACRCRRPSARRERRSRGWGSPRPPSSGAWTSAASSRPGSRSPAPGGSWPSAWARAARCSRPRSSAPTWLGRSALVCLGRWMIPDANQGHRLPAVWATLHPAFRRIYAAVVVGATIVLVVAA